MEVSCPWESGVDASNHAAVYDRISETYDEDFLGLLTRARGIITKQIAAELRDIDLLVDCAIGTAKMVEAIGREVEVRRCIGNDISKQMLEEAKSNLATPFTPICGDALELGKQIDPNCASLLLCHFLYDYCPPSTMIPRLYECVAPGGYLSSATSTKACYDDNFWRQIRKHPILQRVFSVEDNVAQSHTPDTSEHHQAMLKEAGFEIVEHRSVNATIVLENAQSFWNAVYHSGWFVGYLSQFGPATLGAIRLMAGALGLPGVGFYPFQFDARLSIALARKPL